MTQIRSSQLKLETLEQILSQNINESWFDAGQALTAIHQHKLYLEAGFISFEQYLEKRWEMKRQTGYDYIHATAVLRRVRLNRTSAQLPLTHAALLYSLPPDQQVELAERYERERTSQVELRQIVAELLRSIRNGNADATSPELDDAGCHWAVDLRVADVGEPPDDWIERADLQISSPPYCLGIQEEGYVDFDDYDAYLQAMPRWASAMYRVAAPWGRIALVVPVDISRPRRAPVAADWIAAMVGAGWRYQTTIVWEEGNISRSVARGSLDSAGSPNVICPCEEIAVFAKGVWDLEPVRVLRPEWGRSDLTREEFIDFTLGWWTFSGEKPANVGGFPAAFPEELPRRLVKLLSFRGSTVADLFVGSGTTAVVAASLGRQFIGGDINSRWVQFARDRVAVRAKKIAAEGATC